MAGHGLQHPVGFLGGTAKRHHGNRIDQAHPLAYPLKGLTFQAKGGFEGLGAIAGGAPPAQHRILLPGFKGTSPEQLGIFVALEIGKAQDHRFWVERCGNAAHALGQAIDVVIPGLLVAPNQGLDCIALLGIHHPLGMQERQGMDSNEIGNDEFEPGQAHPIAGQGCELEGFFGIAHIEQHPGAGRGDPIQRLLHDAERDGSWVHPALIPLAAAHGDGLAVGNALAALQGADDRRDAEFTGQDRGMAGAASLVGDHPTGPFEDGLPIGVGAAGDQHIPALKLADLAGACQHPRPAMAHG